MLCGHFCILSRSSNAWAQFVTKRRVTTSVLCHMLGLNSQKKRKYLKGGGELFGFVIIIIIFTHRWGLWDSYFKLGVKCGADLLLRPPCSRFVFFLYAAIPQALLHVTLMILQSADLQMSKGPESLCAPIQYIPISIVGKLVSLPISISFSKSVISAWVGFLTLPGSWFLPNLLKTTVRPS